LANREQRIGNRETAFPPKPGARHPERENSATESETRSSPVRVAPAVLAEIAQEAVLAVPGVARLAPRSWRGVGRLFGREQNGVSLRMDDQGVSLGIHVVVAADANMRAVAEQVQRDVARSIRDLAGMQLQRLDVIVADVDFGPESSVEKPAEGS